MSYRVGVDIGGTFIDFCLWNQDTAELHSLKVLSTPTTPGVELLRGLDLLEERHGVRPDQITSFVHGTTIGINTLIQRKGARLGLLATKGFEDVVELARLRMPEAYSLFSRRGEPLVSRDCVFGVAGRVLADGSIETTLDEEDVRRTVHAARAKGVDGIVIALLNAYRNDEQEARAAAIVTEEAPELFVFRSTEVWPVIREYERTTTALINGYVHPEVRDYLDNLIGGLKARGVPAKPLITRSNGGVMSAVQGRRNCVSMVLSGTASGVIGAAFLARQAGEDRVITLDIGGTSADVALIVDGQPQFGLGEKIGDLPLYIPTVSVTSIGDGGGSIAWVDDFGVLKVGPESAGSDPGPACYGRGGSRPTITDAFAVCGFLGQHELAYGAFRPDVELARTAIETVAGPMGLSAEAGAEAIISIAVSNMYVEVTKHVARSGVDPRDFTLLTFGGAGPMLGCFLAHDLEMQRVMVPASPGVVSALGGLVADLRNDFIRTLFSTLSAAESGRLCREVEALERQGLNWLREEQAFDGPAQATWFADMRYHGQSFEIEVALPEGELRAGNAAALTEAFHLAHTARYDFCDRDAPVQIVNLRLVIAGTAPRPAMRPPSCVQGSTVPERQLRVFFSGQWHDVPLYHRATLAVGQGFVGPCVVAQDDTTACIPPGFDAHVDEMGNIILELRRA